MADEPKKDMKVRINRETYSASSNHIPPIAIIAQLSADLRDLNRSLSLMESDNIALRAIIADHVQRWKDVGELIDEMLGTGFEDDNQTLEYVCGEVKRIREAAHHNFHEGHV